VCYRSLHEALAVRAVRGGGSAVTASSLVRVPAQEPTPALAAADEHDRRGQRLATVAMRLDAAPGLAGRRAAVLTSARPGGPGAL